MGHVSLKEEKTLRERLGNAIDQIVTIDFQLRPPHCIDKLYETARNKLGKALTLYAAEKLAEVVNPGDGVIIATGYPLRPWVSPKICENDGPPGAAVLARALDIGLKALPVLVTEEPFMDTVKASCRGAGLLPVGLEEAERAVRLQRGPIHACAVMSFPLDEGKAKQAAVEFIERSKAAAVIAVEKVGRNEKGVYHARGYDISYAVAKIPHLIQEARSRNIFTMGIGDVGDEIGMGLIKEAIKRFVSGDETYPMSKCKCPCGAGAVDDTETDALVVSTVSNWGAYGTAACLSYLLKNSRVLHNGSIEKRILRECTDANAITGGTGGYCAPDVDDIPERIHIYLVEILRTLIERVSDE
jgi:hypothetical protein